MSANPIYLTVPMITETCCSAGCGITFSFPKSLNDQLRQNHKDFYCPNGHAQHYIIKSELEKVREELFAVRNNLNFTRESRDRQMVRADKLERKLTKVTKGRCPVANCKQRFADLKEHIKKAHRNYSKKG